MPVPEDPTQQAAETQTSPYQILQPIKKNVTPPGSRRSSLIRRPSQVETGLSLPVMSPVPASGPPRKYSRISETRLSLPNIDE